MHGGLRGLSRSKSKIVCMKAGNPPGRSHVPLGFAVAKGTLATSPLRALDGREDKGDWLAMRWVSGALHSTHAAIYQRRARR